MRRTRLFTVIVLAMFVLSACNLPGMTVSSAPTLSQDAIFTAAAQTLAVQLTQSAATQMAGQPATETQPPALPSDTPALPGDTPAALPSDTPPPEFTPTPPFTPTPNIPLITASVGTNCRRGPSKLYDPPVGVLPVNVAAEVHGRNSDSSWWYIQLPNKPGVFCWVWAETTFVEGNTALLPVVTPPPLPPTATATSTPGATFEVSFDNVHSCGGTPTAIFEVDNTGGVDLESLNLEIEDLDDDDTLFGPDDSDAPFMGSDGECPPGGDVLKAGKTMFIGGAIGAGNSGHDARATIELCTRDDLEGVCMEVTVRFTIP